MGKLVVGTFVTLDGVMQGPGGPDEDRDGGFEHGGWSVNYWDDMMGQTITEQTVRPDALLLGRRTYEIFAGYWPHVGPEDPVAAKLNSVPKYVVSTTLVKADWSNSTAISGDLAEQVGKLKERHDEIAVTGSSRLIQSLLQENLVDELVVWTFPLVLGSGKRLFGEGTIPDGLECADSKVSTTGVVISTYRNAGAVQYGSFALEQ